jgi:hypothetical protein
MLQIVATLVSLVIASSALALIVGILADDWRSVARAPRHARQFQPSPLAVQPRVTIEDRRPRIVWLSSRPAPERAAA